MAKTILIGGFGTGISRAIAERFGKEGFSVGLVARNAARLEEAARALTQAGINAAAFPGDLSDPAAIKGVVARARDTLGPISVVQWNAYQSGAGDMLAADPAEIRGVLDVAVTGLIAVVKETVEDLRASKGAVLVTNGGLGLLDPNVDALAVQWNAMGLAVANAAKHKLVRVLAEKLKGDGVYVAEVTVLSAVKGTAWDSGSATLEASTIAAKFWDVYNSRRDLVVQIA